MKKVFIISLVLLGVVLLFLGVYNFAFKEKSPAPVQAPVVAKKPAPADAPSRIAAVSDQKVIGPVFDRKNGSLLYYDAKDGTAWEKDPGAKGARQLSDTKLPGLRNVLWSSDRSKVLTMFEKGGQKSFYEYDYDTRKGTKLADGLDTAVWDNLGVKIFYKYFDAATGSRSLSVADPDGSDWQKLADIPFREVAIAPVPLTSLVSFWNSPSAGEETQLAVVGASGGEPRTVFRGRFGADYRWSPDGTQALASSLAAKDGKMVTLGLVTLEGKYYDLNIPTLAAKCAWSFDGKTVYYALPGGIPDGAKMPDDHRDGKFFTEDTFWKMDVASGEKSRLLDAGEIKGKYDSDNLFLSANEGTLYFTNKIDGKLYGLTL